MKSIYKHNQTHQLFAIETDDSGSIQSVAGPMKPTSLDPRALDYDDYWNWQAKTVLPDYTRLSKDDYQQLLKDNGYFPNLSQGTLL